jgi:hypothetical protein
MVIFKIASLKNHIELLLVPRQISEPGFVILSKFWSRFGLWQHRHRNRMLLGDDQGCIVGEWTVFNPFKFSGVLSPGSRLMEIACINNEVLNLV